MKNRSYLHHSLPKKARFFFCIQVLVGFFIAGAHSGVLAVTHNIGSLDQAVSMAQRNPNIKLPLSEIRYNVKKYYYQIQSASGQLDISREVKGHFDSAVKKSEKNFDQGETDISQSDITKLKLGLSGTLNDIIELETELKIAKLYLGNYFGWNPSQNIELKEKKTSAVDFSFASFEDFFHSLNYAEGQIIPEKRLSLEKGFIKAVEAQDKMNLAKKTRKITRALLVGEVANYDFGIGSSGDLFEALIIYTRVLKGYYQSIYNFNLSVAELYR